MHRSLGGVIGAAYHFFLVGGTRVATLGSTCVHSGCCCPLAFSRLGTRTKESFFPASRRVENLYA